MLHIFSLKPRNTISLQYEAGLQHALGMNRVVEMFSKVQYMFVKKFTFIL